jgi:hypothetical protein
MAITSTVTVTGPIAPTTTGDTYPTFDAKYGLDGLRSVKTNADRNAISNDRRREGMIVGVASGSTATYWRLLASPWTGTDSDWTIFNYGTDIFISGMTFNPANYNLTIGRSDNTGFTQNLGILATDVTVTGGTYNINTGVVTFYSNTTNTRTGLYYDGNWSALSAYTAGTVVTYATNNLDYYVISNGVSPNINPPTADTANWKALTGRGVFDVAGFVTGFTDTKVTGGTYNGSSITIGNSDGTTANPITGLTTLYSSDGTINGNRLVTQNSTTLTFSGDSASTFTIAQRFLQGKPSSANGEGSHAQGYATASSGVWSHAEGLTTTAEGGGSHAEGSGSIAVGNTAHAEGNNTQAIGDVSHSEGNLTKSYGPSSHAEGSRTIAYGITSHAEGYATMTAGNLFFLNDFVVHSDNRFSVSSNVTGDIVNTTYPFYDDNNAEIKKYTVTAVTYDNIFDITNVDLSNGDLLTGNRHLLYLVDSLGSSQHAEGFYTRALGDYSHAEGIGTLTYGQYSHAEGSDTQAIGNGSHAEGQGTIALVDYQHVTGQYNTTGNTTSLFVIGNGTDDLNRSDLALFDTTGFKIKGLGSIESVVSNSNYPFNTALDVSKRYVGDSGTSTSISAETIGLNVINLNEFVTGKTYNIGIGGPSASDYNSWERQHIGIQSILGYGATTTGGSITFSSGTSLAKTKYVYLSKFDTWPDTKVNTIGVTKNFKGWYAMYGSYLDAGAGSGSTMDRFMYYVAGGIREKPNNKLVVTDMMGFYVSPLKSSYTGITNAWGVYQEGLTDKNFFGGNVGIGTTATTSALHVSASTNPVRIQGLTATTTDTNALTVDSNGVLHTIAFSAISPTLSFTNGLTRTGNEVVLGGALTGETTLSDGRTVNTTTYTPLLNIHSDRNSEFYTAQELISARKWFQGTSATTTDFAASSNAFRIDNFLELYTGKTYNIYPSFQYPDDFGWDSGHSAIYADLGLGAANASGSITYSAGTNLSRAIYTFMAKFDTWPIVDSSKVVKTHKGWYAMYGAHLDAFGAEGSSIDRLMYYAAGGIKWLSGTTVDDMMGMYIAPMKIDNVDSRYGNTLRHWNASAITNSWGIYQEGSTEKNFFGGNVGIGTTATTSALHVSASTNPVKIEGLSTGTSNTYLLSIDDNGVVSKYPKSSISGGTGSGTSIYWYAENTAHPAVAPIATGTSSIALGSGAQANSSDMFVFGDSAGSGATNTNNSIFLGKESGYNADTSSGSTFIGKQAGYLASSSEDSNFIGNNAGYSARNVSSSNFIGLNAGEYSRDINYSNFIGWNAGSGATALDNTSMIGYYAGWGASNADNSNFMGYHAGERASGSSDSNFFGYNAGQTATSASSSNYIGYFAGKDAGSSSYSNFIGRFAGRSASNSSYSNYIGFYAGYQALSSTGNTFIGYQAGYNARYTNDSIFLGTNAGFSADPVSNLILIGYQAGKRINDTDYLGDNNIIIGNNVSLPDGTIDTLNIGGILFGTGLYSATTGDPFVSASTSGKIGIGVVGSAITNTLHVSASENPLRVEGLTASTTDLNLISIDTDGVAHSYSISNLPGSPQTLQNVLDYSVASNIITGNISQYNEFHLQEPDNNFGLHIWGDSYTNYSKSTLLGETRAGGSLMTNANTTGFYVDGGSYNYIFNNSSSSDYSTYKPLGISSNGDLRNMSDWPSSSSFTGGTVDGPTNFTSGVTADTISAATYYNLPSIDGLYLPISGGTVTGDTVFQSGLTANTISATTISATTISAVQYFLPPRMTESERLGLTAEVGLMVYQTDSREGLYIYKSIGWVQIV